MGFGGHGKTQFAVHAEFLLHQWDVKHLFCIGAGGALHAKFQVLDLVAATEIIEHDYKEKFDQKKQLPRFKCDENALTLFKGYQSDFKVHFVPIASGDEDIVSIKRAEELHGQTQAAAVAWEGAGGARVAKFHRLPYSEIRALTDNACENAANDFHASLEEGMARAGELFHYYISANK